MDNANLQKKIEVETGGMSIVERNKHKLTEQACELLRYI